MLFKLKVLCPLMFFSSVAMAQPDSDSTAGVEDGGLTISGSMDFYYRKSFTPDGEIGRTSFTQSDNQFQLGMASLKLNYAQSKTNVVLDLGFGPRARDFAYADDGILAAVKQAYIDYESTKGLIFTAGIWATHIGYELLDAKDNQNYSMSYLFSTGPFSNAGLKAAYHWKQHQFMLGVTGPTDYRQVPDSVMNKKFLIAQYHYEGLDGLALTLNYTGGTWVDSSKIRQLDAVLLAQLTKQTSLGLNGSYGQKKWKLSDSYSDAKDWWGVALYLKQDLCKHFNLAFREEYFKDAASVTGAAIGGDVWATTLTGNYQLPHFRLMPEFRIDHASTPIFYTSPQVAGGTGKKSNVYFLLAAVYDF